MIALEIGEPMTFARFSTRPASSAAVHEAAHILAFYMRNRLILTSKMVTIRGGVARRVIIVGSVVVIVLSAIVYLYPSRWPDRSDNEDLAPQIDRGSRREDTGTVLPTAREPIASNQTWTVSELLALNDQSFEIFAGNTLRTGRQANPRFEKHFVFPNGEELSISYDFTPPHAESVDGLDNGISGGFFEPLRGAANQGNPTAARHLYESLKSCATAPRSQDEFDTTLRLLREGEIAIPEPVTLEESIGGLETRYRRCAGTTDEMLDEARDILRAAAEKGDGPSAILFAGEVRGADPVLAERLYAELWRSGSVAGLAGLANIYADKAPSSYEEAVKAYAYAYAVRAIRLAEWDGLPQEVFKTQRETILTSLAHLEASAPYNVVERGTALARELIAENQKCCR